MSYGLDQAYGKPISQKASRTDLTRADVPPGFKIGPYDSSYAFLSKFETTCLMLQIAYIESEYDFTLSKNSRLGRYLVGNKLLQKYNFIDSQGTWLGKNGVQLESDFLLNYTVQDLLFEQFLEDSYSSLARNAAILPTDPANVVAGMLAVSYQFQSSTNPSLTALEWRNTGAVNDDQGRPGYVYFNAGKYAVQVLAADIIG